MSSDKNFVNEPSSPAILVKHPEASANLKSWHRPVISRIEIAQTLNGTLASGDQDNGQHTS